MIKRIFFVITATIAIAAYAIWFIGWSSSETYIQTRTETYAAGQSQVWTFLTEVEKLPEKRNEIKKVELLEVDADGKKRWREYTSTGAHIDYRIASENAPQFLSVNMVSESFGMTATWNYSLSTTSPNVTQVKIVEISSVVNPWVRGLMVLSGRGTGLKQEHRHLADEFGFSR